MNNKKLYNLLLIVAGAALAIIAIVVFAKGCFFTRELIPAILLTIVGVLLALLALLFLYLAYISRDSSVNYFLYDTEKRTNIPVDQLSFATVNSKLNAYIATNFGSVKVLWTGDGFEQDMKFGQDDVYRVLIAYKLLYDLVSRDNPKVWELFWQMPEENFYSVTEALNNNGDGKFASRLEAIRSAEYQSTEELRNLLKNNESYIQGKMINYVKTNLDKFN